jgi:hypothetical protein
MTESNEIIEPNDKGETNDRSGLDSSEPRDSSDEFGYADPNYISDPGYPAEPDPRPETHYIAIERRIELFIAIAGALMTLIALARWGLRSAEGVAIGAAVCWANFRWLRFGAASLIRLGLAQAGVENVYVPRSTHAKFMARLLLLVFTAYVILAWLRLPVMAVISGLVAVVPAIVLELGYEVMHGHHRWRAQ